jgi:hypothetical protein
MDIDGLLVRLLGRLTSHLVSNANLSSTVSPIAQTLGGMDLDGLLARLTAPGGLILSDTYNGMDPVDDTSDDESVTESDNGVGVAITTTSTPK